LARHIRRFHEPFLAMAVTEVSVDFPKNGGRLRLDTCNRNIGDLKMSTETGQSQPKTRISFFLTVAFALITAGTVLPQQFEPEHVGVPIDWSTRHVLFSGHGTVQQRVAAMREARFYTQWVQRNSRMFLRGPNDRPEFPLQRRKHIQVDWAMSLGPTGGMPLGESPAKYGFSEQGYSCANDFAVYTIGAAPKSGGQANILAFNNLYTGTASSSCPFGPQTPPSTDYTQPTFMWSYAAGSQASFLSPTLSLDGKKVAFVENGTPATFDVLTWVAGQGTDATHAVTPGTGGSALVQVNYTTSAATGCSSSAGNSNSSPYIDYNSDVAYIGADNGKLYKITGVFKGTPAVAYCVTVKANALLTSPVYDQISNQVFISDGFKVYSYTPGTTGFTAGSSITVSAATTGDPIVLSPIVDTFNGFVYVFSSSGTGTTNKSNTVVSQLNLALSSQTQTAIGPQAGVFFLDGDFDDAYFTNGPKTGAGTLYACGTQPGGTTGTKPSLYAISFASPNGIMNTTPAMSNDVNINGTTNPTGTCSPLLDFFDGTTDRLFVGAGVYNATTGANLVTEWNTTTRITSNTTKPNATATGYWGGTSAFTIDNVNPDPQTTSIYFGTLQPPPTGTTTPCGAGNYCAVKLTQSGLQ
jgi:hypothetical protein